MSTNQSSDRVYGINIEFSVDAQQILGGVEGLRPDHQPQ